MNCLTLADALIMSGAFCVLGFVVGVALGIRAPRHD